MSKDQQIEKKRFESYVRRKTTKALLDFISETNTDFLAVAFEELNSRELTESEKAQYEKLLDEYKDIVDVGDKNFMDIERMFSRNKGHIPVLSTVFSLGLLVSFFLPWVVAQINFDCDFGWRFRINGFDIPLFLDKFSNLMYELGNSGDSLMKYSEILMIYSKLSYLLLLVPLCSVYNIIVGFYGSRKSYFLNEFAIGLICVLGLVCAVFVHVPMDIIKRIDFSVLSVGFYLTILFSVAGVFLNDRKKNKCCS